MKIKNLNILIAAALAGGLFASSAEAAQYGFGSFSVTAEVTSQCGFGSPTGTVLPNITWASPFASSAVLGSGVLSQVVSSSVICSPNPGGNVQLQAVYSANDITTGTHYRLMALGGTSAPYFAYQLRIKAGSPISSPVDGTLWGNAAVSPDPEFQIAPSTTFYYAAVALGNTNTPITGPVTVGTGPANGGSYSEDITVNILSP